MKQRLRKLAVLLATEVRRDTQNLVGFSVKYLWIFFPCFIYGFFLKSAVAQKNIRIDGYFVDFSLFLVSGLVAARTIPLSIRIFDETLSSLKNSDLTEWVLTTPTSFWELFAVKSIWNFIRALTEILALIGFAGLFIETPFWPFLQISFIGPVVLLFAASMGIGMIISSLSILLRKGSVLFAFFFQISAAFGGVFFPPRLLAEKFEFLSLISTGLPITHALNVMRFALIHQQTSGVVTHERTLAAMAVVLPLTGFILLQRSLAWARKNGNL